MAILTTIVDDYTGKDRATRTVRMSFEGDYFDLDLSDASYETVKGMFADLMARGRRTTANSKMRQPSEWAELNPSPFPPNTEAAQPEPAVEPQPSQTELDIERGAPPAKASHGVTSKDLDPATRQIMRKWAQDSEWAKKSGIVVPARGALGQNIIDAYLSAHPAKLKPAK